MTDIAKLKERYGKSAQGNFEVADTIGVPHLYCIGPRHVAHASDHFCGRLGKEAIESGEKQGIHCATPRCTLTFAEHKQRLLVECHADLHQDGKVNPELHAYLLAVKDKAIEDKYEGFAFVDRRTP